METILCCLLVANFLAMVLLSVDFIVRRYLTNTEERRQQADLTDWFKIYVIRYRGHTNFQNIGWYHLQSFDGGLYWVAIDRDGTILGEAESVWPGLLHHLSLVSSPDHALPVEWYQRNYRRQQGFNQILGVSNYELLSIDGGRNWIAIAAHGQILGDANVVYPGLLDHFATLEALTDYALKHGPIDGQAPTSKQIELLQQAGFAVARTTS